jgi:hypothetical protein
VENATYYVLWVEDSEEKIDYYLFEPEDVGCDSEEVAPGATCNADRGDTKKLTNGSYNWVVSSWIPPTDGETNFRMSDPLSFTVTGAPSPRP